MNKKNIYVSDCCAVDKGANKRICSNCGDSCEWILIEEFEKIDKKKNKIIKVLLNLNYGLIIISEIIFKGSIFVFLNYLIGFAIGYLQVNTSIGFDILHTLFIIGGLWWIMKDSIILSTRKLNNKKW